MRPTTLLAITGPILISWSGAFAQWAPTVPGRSYTLGSDQSLGQDEARRDDYCQQYSESQRVEVLNSLGQKSDETSRADVAYILANCPPSQAAQQQHAAQQRQQFAQAQSKYLAVTAFYQANGEFQAGGEGEVFDSAQDCDRFAVAQMKKVMDATDGGVTVAGESVLIANDATGYMWYGCIHPNAERTDAYVRYVGAKMSAGRAKVMKRFPNL